MSGTEASPASSQLSPDEAREPALLPSRSRWFARVPRLSLKIARRLSTRWLSAGVFGATFLFRWLTLEFENDYFMHVAWAAEMLRGDWPVRDFVEPGFPLQTGLAYLAFRLAGTSSRGKGRSRAR